MWETERAVGGLVEGFDERDVEATDFCAETEVDVGLRPWVRGFEGNGAAGEGPFGAVRVGAGGLVDAAT